VWKLGFTNNVRFSFHPTAGILGETGAVVSMIALRSPMAATQRVVIDKTGPLAILAVER
jgi:hypothetical protein